MTVSITILNSTSSTSELEIVSTKPGVPFTTHVPLKTQQFRATSSRLSCAVKQITSQSPCNSSNNNNKICY